LTAKTTETTTTAPRIPTATTRRENPKLADGPSGLPPAQELDPVTEVADPDALRELVRGNTAFASDIYAEVVPDEENILVSPYSISAAIAMTRAGAQGETAEALDDALRYTAEGDALHESFSDLHGEMDARNDVELDEDEEFILRRRQRRVGTGGLSVP